MRVALDKIPFFFFSILFGFIAIHAAKELDTSAIYNFTERIQIAAYALLFYLYKFILPIHLSAFYPYPFPPGKLPFFFWCFPLLVCALVGFVCYSIRFTRKLIFGFAFFFCATVLMLQFFAVGECFAADRYSYVPFIGLFYIAGEGFDYLSVSPWISKPWKFKSFLAVFIAGIFLLFFTTNKRIKIWKNSFGLFNDVVEKYPGEPFGYNFRGLEKEKTGDIKGALEDFNKALLLKPEFAIALNNRGSLRIKLMDYQGGIEDLNKSLVLFPYSDCYNNRGKANALLGNYHRALEDFSKAIQMGNTFMHLIMFNRAMVYYNTDTYNLACRDFTKAIELFPDYGDAYFYRGKCKYILTDFDGACKDWNQASHLGNENAAKTLTDNCFLFEDKNKYLGVVKQYYKSGNISVLGLYEGNQPFGHWKEFYDNPVPPNKQGTLMEEYDFDNGQKNGSDKYYHFNGKLWAERFYKDGKLWEVFSNFDINGRPLERGNFKKGSGNVNIYSEEGTLMETIVYVNGLKVQ